MTHAQLKPDLPSVVQPALNKQEFKLLMDAAAAGLMFAVGDTSNGARQVATIQALLLKNGVKCWNNLNDRMDLLARAAWPEMYPVMEIGAFPVQSYADEMLAILDTGTPADLDKFISKMLDELLPENPDAQL